ncbi:MAG TPA: STM3941 family protein [Acidothermaceae bacterium]|jgi:hypothetical protein
MASPQSTPDLRIGGGRSTFLAVAGSAGFVIFSIALIARPNGGAGAKTVGVLVAVVFGCFFVLSLRLVRAGGRYVLTASGIQFLYQKWPMLPWSDIHATRIVTWRRRRYLAIDVRNADARVRHMKSGARAGRHNLRAGLGLIAIPEQMSPTSLEELQREIERRRTTTSATAVDSDQGATILPKAAGAVPPVGTDTAPPSVRTLRNVAIANAVWLLATTARRPAVATPRALLFALAAAFLLGALALHLHRLFSGLVTIVAAAIVLAVIDLTVGTHIAVASRVGYLFFPFGVLLVALAAWPRHPRRF